MPSIVKLPKSITKERLRIKFMFRDPNSWRYQEVWRVHPKKEDHPNYYLSNNKVTFETVLYLRWPFLGSLFPLFLLHIPNCAYSFEYDENMHELLCTCHMSTFTKDRSGCLRESCSYSGGSGFFNGEGSRGANARGIQGTFQQAKPSSPYEKFAKERMGEAYRELILKKKLERKGP